MKRSVRIRTLAVLAASASLFAVPFVAPASAAVPQPGKCTKLTTKTVNKQITATLTGCTPVAATGGKGGGAFTSTGAPAGTLNITIKWAAAKGTTKVNLKFANQKTRGKCAVGATRVKLSGQVTGGTGTAVKTFKKGQPIAGSVCNHPTKGFSIEPGSALTF